MEYCESLTPPKTVVKHALRAVRTRSHLQGLALPSFGHWEMRIMGPVSSNIVTTWTGWNACQPSWYQSQTQRYFFMALSLRCLVLVYAICLFCTSGWILLSTKYFHKVSGSSNPYFKPGRTGLWKQILQPLRWDMQKKCQVLPSWLSPV